MTSSQEIAELSDKLITEDALQCHKLILKNFSGLPTVLKVKISTFHKSQYPCNVCVDCEEVFYQLSDINNERGYLCEPCVSFYIASYDDVILFK